MMNSRIKDLACTAGIVFSDQGVILNGTTSNLMKFAELLVFESANYMDNNISYDNANNTFPVLGDDLIEYFGIPPSTQQV